MVLQNPPIIYNHPVFYLNGFLDQQDLVCHVKMKRQIGLV